MKAYKQLVMACVCALLIALLPQVVSAQAGTKAPRDVQQLDAPRVAVDSRIEALDSPAISLDVWPEQQFITAIGVAVDGSGNVYVSDHLGHNIQKFDNNGTFLSEWGSEGSGDGQFLNPVGVAVDPYGDVYVSDTSNNRIQKFDGNGTFLTKWGAQGSGDGQFLSPIGVAVDGSGNVYVAEANNHRIQKFTSGGIFLAKWGEYGSGDGQFAWPQGVAVDGSGNVYVADPGNQRIQKFASDGTFLGKWGSYGSDDGQFRNTFGVAVDGSGNVYATDTYNYRVQKFDANGTFLAKWGEWGSGDGQFRYPQGVAVDGSCNVFVTDFDRIQKFATDCIAPTISAAATTAPNSDGWYNSDVIVRFTCSDNQSGIPEGACPADQVLASEGAAVTSVAQTVVDAAGNVSAASNVVTAGIDKTPPVLAPAVTPNPVLLNGAATVTCGATDTLSGLAAENCGPLDTTTVGTKSVSCTATDKAGNAATTNVAYSIIYNFNGFFPPVDNEPVQNVVKAGSGVPVKFSLSGSQGLDIFAAGSPASVPIACESGAPFADIEQTVAANVNSFSYDAASDTYVYVWKTDKAWANTCRQLLVMLNDGTQHAARFQFK